MLREALTTFPDKIGFQLRMSNLLSDVNALSIFTKLRGKERAERAERAEAAVEELTDFFDVVQKVEELEVGKPILGFDPNETALIRSFLGVMSRESNDPKGLEGMSAAEVIDLLHSYDEGDRDLIVACLDQCRGVFSSFLGFSEPQIDLKSNQ